MKKLKIKATKEKQLTDNDKELLRLAEIYPADTKLQKLKQRMLIKRHIIDRTDSMSESFSSRQSANSDNPKNTRQKLAEVKQQSLIGAGTNSMKCLERINSGFQQCKFESGVLNPQKVFEFMNQVQKNDDPDAYQPEIVKTIQQREQLKKQQEKIKENKKFDEMNKLRRQLEHEQALFDFDQDIDDLEQVEERYQQAGMLMQINTDTDVQPKDNLISEKENMKVLNTETKENLITETKETKE